MSRTSVEPVTKRIMSCGTCHRVTGAAQSAARGVHHRPRGRSGIGSGRTEVAVVCSNGEWRRVMSMSDITELQRALGQVKQAAGDRRAKYGAIPAVRRLVNDVERMDIDTAEFRSEPTAPQPRRPQVSEHEVVGVPDTPYDPAMWRGSDDEFVRHDD